jgi:Na+-driven multidrug efflux pump
MADSTAQQLTQRRIFAFWLPLAATWLMMATEGPFLAAVIARLADPTYNLAAYGVALSIALLVESPIIMIMSAATALVRDRASYLAMRNFTNTLNAGITLLMLVALVPPVFDVIARGLLGLSHEVAHLAHTSVALLLPWPAAIGFRRFYQGVLIRRGLTRLVAYGTVIRLAGMAVTALALFGRPGLEGAWIGAAALSAGVTLEALAARAMAHRSVAELKVTAGAGPPLGYPEIARFYYPLALTTILNLGLLPIVTFFMGHAPAPLESLAVLPVVGSLVFVFRALGLAYQEASVALIGDRFEGYQPLRRFAATLGVAVTIGLGVIAWTPLSQVWFERVSGLSPELARFALTPTRVLVFIPALTVLLSFQRAILVNSKATGHVTWATLIEVGFVVGILCLGIFGLHAVGLVVAAVALVVGRLCANLYQVAPLRRLRAARA